jgi:hypothetical protein
MTRYSAQPMDPERNDSRWWVLKISKNRSKVVAQNLTRSAAMDKAVELGGAKA